MIASLIFLVCLKTIDRLNLKLWISGFPQALEILENLENHQKSSMHGKIMECKKKE